MNFKATVYICRKNIRIRYIHTVHFFYTEYPLVNLQSDYFTIHKNLWNNDSISASIDNKDNESKKDKFPLPPFLLLWVVPSANYICVFIHTFITLDLLSCTSELLFLNILKFAFKFINNRIFIQYSIIA